MNLKHAAYVLAVLREGSITAAARKLYISQPSLSQTIKQVEQNLGAPIFDRGTEPLALTYEGQLYVKAVEQVMMIHTNLHNEIQELKKETRGRLRLGISIQRGMHLLPLVVPPFTQKYPYVKLELVEHGSDTLERLTIEGECDLALITTNEKPSALEYVLIENEQLVLMADRNTAIAQRIPDGTPVSITEAAQERFVSLRPGHSVRVIQDRLFSQHAMSPTILLESNSLEACKNVASRAGAVMICPYVFIAGQSELLNCVHCYPILGNDYERHFYLCYRRGLYLTRYMEDFIEIVRHHINIRL